MTIACMGFKGSTGLPIHERGYVEDQLWSVSAEVSRSVGWWTDLLPALSVNADRMAQMAGAHRGQATDLAGTLVRERNMGWRTAHQVVGILCRLAEERGLSPAEATPELLDEAAVQYMGEAAGLSQSAITAALDAARFPARRTLYGGPAPAALARELAGLRQQLAVDENSLAARRAGLEDAATRMHQAIESICRG